jgi:outer membrane autotransporter protein
LGEDHYPIVSLDGTVIGNNAPILSGIGDQTGTVGTPISLSISASDGDGDTLTYSATGLPTGLSIDSASGLISGTPLENGSFATTVTVTDGTDPDSENFTWVIGARPNPLENKEVIDLIQSQATNVVNIAHSAVAPVKDRLNNLLSAPRDRLSSNSRQGIQLSMNIDPAVNTLLSQTGLLSGLAPSGDLFNNGWAVWTAGEVTLGKGRGSSDFHIESLTVGADKRITPAFTAGLAFRIGQEDNDVGTASKVDSEFFSGTAYASYSVADRSYVQGALGYSKIDISTERADNAGALTGNRDAEQVYLSITLTREFDFKGLTLLPYGSLDGSHSKLDAYSEVGSFNALSYNEQKIKALSGTVGLRGSYLIKHLYGIFSPRFHINYQGDIKSDSSVTVNFVNIPSTTFTRSFDANASSSWLFGLGIDYSYEKVNFSADYERTQQIDWGYSNTFRLKLSAQF